MKGSKISSVIRYLKERIAWDSINYEIPAYSNTIFYSFGGITLCGICILFITGFFLSQFYTPDIEYANNSLHYIINDIFLGWFIRNLHFWSASLVCITLGLHIIRILVTAAFKSPREFNWVIGTLMGGLIFLSLFSGTVLKWDQEGYEALEHNIWIAERIGYLGMFFWDNFSNLSLLGRIYTLHISIIPILLVMLISLHLLLVKLLGISPLPWKEKIENKSSNLFSHIRCLILYGTCLLWITSILALLISPPLGGKPIEGIEITKPLWMFLWIYSLENIWMPSLLFAPPLLFILLLSVPFIERNKRLHPLERVIPLSIITIFILTIIILTINGLLASAKHIM